MNKPLIISDKTRKSIKIKKSIIKLFQKKSLIRSNVLIVIGGDGFMLQTLKKYKNSKKIFYGINSGNFGFLMNKYSMSNLIKNLNKGKIVTIFPLEMKVKTKSRIKKFLAINEVSILRQSRQAAFLSIKNNTKYIIKKLICDGVLVSTPAGSTAYNFSVRGPVLSLDSKKISIASISAFRPRHWKGKITNDNSKIKIKNLDITKRPISAVADNQEIRNAEVISVKKEKKIKFSLLYNSNKSLQTKNKLEQMKKYL